MKWSTYNTSFKNVFIYKHRHKNWTKTQIYMSTKLAQKYATIQTRAKNKLVKFLVDIHKQLHRSECQSRLRICAKLLNPLQYSLSCDHDQY